MGRIGIICFILCSIWLCACAPKEDNPASPIQPQSAAASSLPPAYQEEAGFGMEQPVFVTSLGQSADLLMLTAILGRLDITCTSNAMAVPDDLGEARTVILVVGASSKGLAASEMALEDEQARAEKWATALEMGDRQVVVAYLGGSARRDDPTMSLVQLILPSADALLVVSEGDTDHYFKDFAADIGIPYLAPPSVAESKAWVSRLFEAGPSH